MLNELRITSLGIIEELNWEIKPGLNIISGETGSGKSLIIEALEILFFGSGCDSDIRYGSDTATIEAYFDLDGQTPGALLELLDEKKLDSGSGEMMVTAHLKKNGRNVFRINSNPVPKNLLEDVGRLLFDIHGQTQHLSLYDRSTHLKLLDRFGSSVETRDDYYRVFSQLQQLQHEQARLDRFNDDVEKRRDFLNFQLQELQQADVKPGEDLELENELNKLTSLATIKEHSWNIYQSLLGDSATGQNSAYDCLNQALEKFSHLVEIDPHLISRFQSLQEASDKIEELGCEIRRYAEEMESSSEIIEEKSGRLELIGRLKRKYGGSIDSLLSQQKDICRELEEINNVESDQERMKTEAAELMGKLADLAGRLTGLRTGAARELEQKIASELAELNMSEVLFKVSVEQKEQTGGLPVSGKEYRFGKEGVDAVEFLVSTNPGEPLKPVAGIASTGEISRFTMALKNALAGADAVPTMIFDEIDIGVGGRSAEVLGRKLWSLGRHHQVICITHLPQIAAYADSHYRVVKTSRDHRNTTTIHALDETERIEELAAMISPRQHSEKSVEVARELSLKASDWKQKH